MTSHRLASRAALAGVVVLALALSGCGPKPTASSPAPSTEKSAPPGPPELVLWPLTGQGGKVANRPAVAVKIENAPEARPQTGLGEADIVFEEMVEGGISRFMAVYHSQLPESIGPIRSIRPMDGPIAAPLKGLLAFSGGQPQFQDSARADGLQLLSFDAGSPGFTRDPQRYAPHNIYGSLATFIEQADDTHRDVPPAQFTYALHVEAATAVTDGKKAERLLTAISQVSRAEWQWSSDEGSFLRFEGQIPSKDAISGKQLAAANVLALWVTTRNAGGHDAAGSPIPETILVDSNGKGILATGGRVLDVTWSKKKAADPIEIKDADGGAVDLGPGNTWVELVPQGLGAIKAS